MSLQFPKSLADVDESVKAAAREASSFKEAGFKAVKIKMDILMIEMMRQGCQDIGRYIICELCCVVCDDASRSWSKSTLGVSDGIDTMMPQGSHDRGGL